MAYSDSEDAYGLRVQIFGLQNSPALRRRIQEMVASLPGLMLSADDVEVCFDGVFQEDQSFAIAEKKLFISTRDDREFIHKQIFRAVQSVLSHVDQQVAH